MRQNQQHQSSSSPPCHDESAALDECLSINGPLNSDACVQEKLTRKECLAKLFCPTEARQFYNSEVARSSITGFGGNIVSCSTIVQRFAFPENELLVSHEVSKDKTIRQTCRRVVHDLSKCMSKHKTLWST